MRVAPAWRRSLLPLFAAVTAVLCASACEGPTALEVADDEALLRTDRTAYVLEYEPELFWVDLTVTYRNPRSRPVYFHRRCGYGDEPHRQLIRSDSSGADIKLGGSGCTTGTLKPPIEVGPGETFVDEVRLYSTLSPGANPPITMDQRTGTFRLVYFIQTDNRVEGWEAVALLPEGQRVSNSFQVTPPAN
jgi:hypothetical protein